VVSATTPDPAQVGVVLKQSPAAGARVRKGATVTITVGVLGSQTTPTTPTTTTPTTPTTPTTTAPPPGAPAG
jgi:beta-lactam-binding protein with PASTA domain